MKCVCGHERTWHLIGRKCQGLDAGQGHLSSLCGCQAYRLPWWAKAPCVVGWFLFDLVTRSVAALLAFIALVLLACAAWIISHGVRVLPFALVTLLACAGCGNEGTGGLAACSSSSTAPDAGPVFRGPPPVVEPDAGTVADVLVGADLQLTADTRTAPDVLTVTADALSAPVDSGADARVLCPAYSSNPCDTGTCSGFPECFTVTQNPYPSPSSAKCALLPDLPCTVSASGGNPAYRLVASCSQCGVAP